MPDIEMLALSILEAVRTAKPCKWSTWDAWAGRAMYHEEKIERAQLRAVIEVLKQANTEGTDDVQEAKGLA